MLKIMFRDLEIQHLVVVMLQIHQENSTWDYSTQLSNTRWVKQRRMLKPPPLITQTYIYRSSKIDLTEGALIS